MKTIKLTQGQETVVDDDFVVEHRYYAYRDYSIKSRVVYYAERKVTVDGKKKHQGLAHDVLGIKQWELNGKQVDHINGNRLDNRRENLRIVTNQQNQMNKQSRVNTSSIYKGVAWYKPTKKWCSRIGINGILYHLGLYDTQEQAAFMYNKIAHEFFGEYAQLNDLPNDIDLSRKLINKNIMKIYIKQIERAVEQNMEE